MALLETYRTKVAPALQKEFGFKNLYAVPTIKKITLNVGLGKGLKDAKYLEAAEKTLRSITGQSPVKTKARISISTFKIRKGMVVGMKVTLRGKRMWDFLEKMITLSLPRVRDFRGLPSDAFDGQGNYSIGFSEHISFPEIATDEVETIHGLQVTVATNADTDAEARALLKGLGLPIKEAQA